MIPLPPFLNYYHFPVDDGFAFLRLRLFSQFILSIFPPPSHPPLLSIHLFQTLILLYLIYLFLFSTCTFFSFFYILFVICCLLVLLSLFLFSLYFRVLFDSFGTFFYFFIFLISFFRLSNVDLCILEYFHLILKSSILWLSFLIRSPFHNFPSFYLY